MLKQVGITGGIGSGKSTVARIFSTLGYEIYYADDRAKMLTDNDPEVVEQIKNAFGEDLYLPTGTLDRKKLAGIVFSDKEKLAILNSIVHPAIPRDFKNWLDSLPSDYPYPFILKEAAILFEAGTWKHSDGIITVYAPKNIRLGRVLKRDSTQREAVLKRMENQWPDERKIKLADYVIYNDGEHMLIPQVREAALWFTQKFALQASHGS